MPPPVTPSAHRFLPGVPRNARPDASSTVKKRHAGPSSLLPENTFQDEARVIPTRVERAKVTSARSTHIHPQQYGQTQTPRQQFARTPRFSYTKSTQAASTPAPTPTARALARPPAEDVEEAMTTSDEDDSDSDTLFFRVADKDDEDDVMLLEHAPEVPNAVPTTEVDHHAEFDSQRRHAPHIDLPYSPKRRKLLQPAVHNDETRAHIQSVPHIAGSVFARARDNSHPSRLPFMSGATSNGAREDGSTLVDDEETSRRPVFLKPARAAAAASAHEVPLPEAFSPHRRGHKYVPGGMAATMQQWIYEAGQSAWESRQRGGRTATSGPRFLRADDYVLRFMVQEQQGSGPYFLRGLPVDEDSVAMCPIGDKEGLETRMMLSAGSRLQAPLPLEPGCVIGIRAPTWVVVLKESSMSNSEDGRQRQWSVGADWRVLSGPVPLKSS